MQQTFFQGNGRTRKRSVYGTLRAVGAIIGFMALLLAMPAFAETASTSASCERLAQLTLPAATVTLAQPVAQGTFVPPAGTQMRPGVTFKDLPDFCRVAATLKPSSDSDVRIEVWMPLKNWNGRFQAVGNGGLAGTISYPAMAQALGQGYATASTDTGHAAEPEGAANWAVGHPERVIDFGYRSVHEMAAKAKAVIAAYYGSAPRYSYWNGCSEGGRQGMGEVQRYPADFDGVVDGAPVFYFTHAQSRGFWSEKIVYEDPAAYIPPAKYQIVYDAVMAQCDAADGLKDGLINDPSRCHFDPALLLCKEGDAPNCLTAPQIKNMKSQYEGPVNPRTGERVMTGHMPGFETLLVGRNATAPADLKQARLGAFYRYFVFENPNWDWTTFDFDKDIAFADQKLAAVMNNYDPNLKDFKARGGKLLQYHGWSDPMPSPMNTVNYFNQVQATLGDTRDFYRLFMVPGMGHCSGGTGPDQFDKMGAIIDWVEHGKAPDQIVASHQTNGKADRTRPLCPYPQVAKYKGSGSIDEAENFVCAEEKK
jgi:feruloyl esterase